MRGWGSKTPKRTSLWSNSRAIRKFRTAAKHSKAPKKSHQLADVYFDRAGRKRYKGNRHLKGSQCKTEFHVLYSSYSSWCFSHDVFQSFVTVLQVKAHIWYIHFLFMELREYPRGFGVRFASTMKYFQKERAMVTYRKDGVNWLQVDLGGNTHDPSAWTLKTKTFK